MTNIQNMLSRLTLKAQKLSDDFNQLLEKSTYLLAEGQSVKQKLIDCCGVQDDQLLKNLVKYCNDDDRILQLLENAELKQTVDEYKNGVKQIMDKYKDHCVGNILHERYKLSDRYIARLQEVVNSLDRRLEEMTTLMIFSVGLEEDNSKENQRIIQQLTRDNEQMRLKLQISNDANDPDYFQQGLPPGTDYGTQTEPDDTVDDDLSSSNSCNSYKTSLSPSFDCQSIDNSTSSGMEEYYPQ